jgi:type IV secretion system protein VirB1
MIELHELVKNCAPNVAPKTMLTIIKTESNGNPYIINDNTNKVTYRPKDKEEAINISFILLKMKHNLDLGLMQINSTNAKKMHLTLNNLFNPCDNIKTGALILSNNFRFELKKTSNEQLALLNAISMYNTGNSHKGFTNGYVSKVLKNSKQIILPPNKVLD